MDAVDDQRAGSLLEGDEPEHTDQSERDPDAAVSAADPRTTIAGRYNVDLTTPPREAGIAATYLGRDLRTRDPVEVKTLRLEYRSDPEMRARFRREARLLQFLSHPNVIRALTYTEERGAPWLVLEHVRGRTLREEFAGRGPLSPDEVVPILQGLAAALDHLHARGLIHLDVRPDHVVISPDGEVKLVDFGVAQAASSVPETVDRGAASAAYLAPEQVAGEPVSAATDVYALGCIVYELLSGEPAFPAGARGADRHAAIRSRLETAPTPPTNVRGDGTLPAWVDDVVAGALERDPRLRYGSASSFATVFRNGVEGDVDVETGRPRRDDRSPTRHIPVNEPAIAVKGAPLLASRRGKRGEAADEAIVDASFSALTGPESAAARSPRVRRSLDTDAFGRWLWRAVVVAAALNVLLVAALLLTRGELPGLWSRPPAIGPGATVRVAGVGLVAREGPAMDAPIVADLPEGGTIRISGEPMVGDDGLWWPIELETAEGVVRGYVPQSWVQAP
jgi:tRNA A-37 threonylcarbamoyl transferase component Bud32